jgi:hypothetical protein
VLDALTHSLDSQPRLGKRRFVVLLAALCVSACAGTSFNVQYAPGFVPAHKRISTFAVKRDGLLSHSGWEALGSDSFAPFGAKACDVAYGEALFNAKPELAEAIDSYVRSNGVTDDLLDQLAPAAQGDTILLVTIAGRPHQDSGGGGSSQAIPSAGGGRRGGFGRGGGGRRGGGARGGGMRGNTSDASTSTAPFQVSALLFSIHEHHTQALIEMDYAGTSFEEALLAFKDRLETELPGAACSGWNWSVPVEAASIRKLAEE